MQVTNKIAGRIFNSSLLIVLIPAILILWAGCTGNAVTLPVPDPLLFGYLPLFAGVALLFSGAVYQFKKTEELPGNVIQPEISGKAVLAKITGYPVCTGAAMICFGLSAVSGSSSGFWLVSPLFALMIIAVTRGFNDYRTRPGIDAGAHEPFLSLPPASDISPLFPERIKSCFLAFIPWLLMYEAFIFIGAPDDPVSTNLPFEDHLPVWEFSEIFYLLAFVFSLSVPFVLKTSRQLRFFVFDIWFTTFFVGIIFMVFPLVVEQRDFIPRSFLGRLILFERSTDGESGALPSGHVIWAFLSAAWFTVSYPRYSWAWYTLAVVISASCMTTAAHSIADVVAGYVAFLIVIYRKQLWGHILQKAEQLSVCRRNWKIGTVRISVYGISLGIAGFVAVLLAGFFIGEAHVPPGFFIFTGSLAMAAPWALAIGRLGFLLKGKNQGVVEEENGDISIIQTGSGTDGISYRNGDGLFPGQIYSAVTDLITGLVLISLFNLGMSSSFISGIYLILTGTANLAKETSLSRDRPLLRGRMNSSHLIAIIFILSGIFFTSVPGSPVLSFSPNLLSLALAAVAGTLVTMVSAIEMKMSHHHPTTSE
jgi:hypothetical protein